ncbi:hypothetical protein PG985_004513 [Apiospora marii]|uniref:uncharacterized protein n=1 Tax=Apiospora marii TaxID=335849 RepID=UPI00312F69CA
MKTTNLLWVLAGCGSVASAIDESPSDPTSWIEVCNGRNHNNECGKVDMSEKYLGQCKTIPVGVFYAKVMSVKFEGLPQGSCCELFEGVDCTRDRVKVSDAVPDLGAICNFGGDGGTTGKTRSFACHRPEECAKLGYTQCKEVS